MREGQVIPRQDCAPVQGRVALAPGKTPWRFAAAFVPLAFALFAPSAYAAQVCTVATQTNSIPAPIAASQMIYAPTHNKLVLRSPGDVRSIDLTTGQSTTYLANANFVDMAISPSGRYVFVADYGGENIGYSTPAAPSYVHRVDLSNDGREDRKSVV